MYLTPTIPEIGAAFRALLADNVGNKAFIAPTNQESNPALNQIIVLNALKPASTKTEELGGRIGLGLMSGDFLITLSYLKGDNTMYHDAWSLATDLSRAFRQLEIIAGGGKVNTEEVTVTDVGQSLDANRNAILVSVAWWAWTGGEE